MAVFKTTYDATKAANIAFAARDFILVLGGGLALVIVVLLSDLLPVLQPLRLLLGLVYVFYVPGYCLAAALFPQVDDLDSIERIGLSLGLGVAIVPLLSILLDRLPWGLRLWPILLGEYVVIVLCIAVALGQRLRARPSQAYAPNLNWRPRRWWRGLPSLERRIYGAISAALLLAALCSAWILLVPAPDTYMTEFYMLGEQGRAEDYPRQATPGQQVAVTVYIANRERAADEYRIEVWVADRWQPQQRVLVQRVGPTLLEPGQDQGMPISWITPAFGDDQSVELLLFHDGSPEPYRRLQLWINVQK